MVFVVVVIQIGIAIYCFYSIEILFISRCLVYINSTQWFWSWWCNYGFTHNDYYNNDDTGYEMEAVVDFEQKNWRIIEDKQNTKIFEVVVAVKLMLSNDDLGGSGDMHCQSVANQSL